MHDIKREDLNNWYERQMGYRQDPDATTQITGRSLNAFLNEVEQDGERVKDRIKDLIHFIENPSDYFGDEMDDGIVCIETKNRLNDILKGMK